MSIVEYTIGLAVMAAMIITVLTVGTLASAELLPRVKRTSEVAKTRGLAAVTSDGASRETPAAARHSSRAQHAA